MTRSDWELIKNYIDAKIDQEIEADSEKRSRYMAWYIRYLSSK